MPSSSISSPPPTDAPTDIDIAAFLRFLDDTTMKQGISGDSPRRRTLDIDSNQLSELYGPLTGASESKKSRSVMDALVAVCISGAGICLALSVTLSPTIVHICIAQNGIKPPKIIAAHLQDIWTQLRAISELRQTNPQAKQPQIRDMKALKSKLAAKIHRFCFMKTKHRVKKYMNGFSTFYKYYRDENRRLASEILDKIMFSLMFIQRTVTEIAAKKPLGPMGVPDGPEWERLARQSKTLVGFYEKQDKELLEARMRYIMVEWRSEPFVKASNTLSGFDLPKALMKMITLTTHIQELIKFAYSSRLRHILSCNLSINLLDPVISHITPPSSTTTTRLITTALSSTSFADQAAILVAQISLITTLSPWPSSIPAHAEITILLHHHHHRHTESGTAARPFAYIAVNKLSCVCCWSFFAAYTAATNRIFLLRGSHAKLYFPWWPATTTLEPQLAARVRASLWDVLVRLFETHLKAEKVSRKSDSTVASGEGDDDLDDNDLEMFEQDLMLLEKELEE